MNLRSFLKGHSAEVVRYPKGSRLLCISNGVELWIAKKVEGSVFDQVDDLQVATFTDEDGEWSVVCHRGGVVEERRDF